mgnify:CR=1 FL=1
MKYSFIIFHNRECNFWLILKRRLESFIREKQLDAEIKEILVNDDEEAKNYHFAGSPQLMLNGKDIDLMAGAVTNFHASGCRPVFWKGKFYDYPPMEMIEEAIKATGQ